MIKKHIENNKKRKKIEHKTASSANENDRNTDTTLLHSHDELYLMTNLNLKPPLLFWKLYPLDSFWIDYVD